MTNSRGVIVKVASIAEAKSHLSALIAEVESGQELLITRRGKPVARVIREPLAVSNIGWSELRALVESHPAQTGPTVAAMREQDLL